MATDEYELPIPDGNISSSVEGIRERPGAYRGFNYSEYILVLTTVMTPIRERLEKTSESRRETGGL